MCLFDRSSTTSSNNKGSCYSIARILLGVLADSINRGSPDGRYINAGLLAHSKHCLLTSITGGQH